jgi:F-type H+-transporting ATPase subunit epsilon
MADFPTAITLDVATPLGMALSLQTDSVQVPSALGEVGVLPGHLPLLAALRPGIMAYRQNGQLVRAAVGAGYVEVTTDSVRLIAEFFMLREQIDVELAQKDLHASEGRLKACKGTIDDIEYLEAEREVQWAQARLQLVASAAN